jgi:hypothetical protein
VIRGKRLVERTGMMTGNSEELERLRRQLEKVTAEWDKLLAENRRLRRDDSTSPQKSGKVGLNQEEFGFRG